MGGLIPTDPISRLLTPLTSLPTGMTLSTDGQLLVVLTYSSLHFFHREADQGWAEAIRQPIASRSLPHIDQWEGVALSGDGRYVTVVREDGGDDTMHRLAVPASVRETIARMGGTTHEQGDQP